MGREFQDYIDRVLYSIGVGGRKEKQIREDLYVSLMEKQQITGESDPYILLGNTEDVAEEFRENLEIKPNTRYCYRYSCGYRYEYVSKIKVFGLPLVHINTKPFGIAKGIFSIGNIAIGIVSLGGVSIGVLSFGGLALGLLVALGGGALSGLLSIGGITISYAASMGGIAIAKYIAVGGIARADIAIGGVAKGIVAVFNQQGTGRYMFKTPVSGDEVTAAIKMAFPKIGRGLLNILRTFYNK